MALVHWSDYHEWLVPADAFLMAHLLLAPGPSKALIDAGTLRDSLPGILVPRDVIESTALALPPAAGARFLALVYDLDAATGERLLGIIRDVRVKEST